MKSYKEVSAEWPCVLLQPPVLKSMEPKLLWFLMGNLGQMLIFNQESGFIGGISSPALHWTEKANHSSCMSLNVEMDSKCWQQNTETQKYFGKVADRLCS